MGGRSRTEKVSAEEVDGGTRKWLTSTLTCRTDRYVADDHDDHDDQSDRWESGQFDRKFAIGTGQIVEYDIDDDPQGELD